MDLDEVIKKLPMLPNVELAKFELMLADWREGSTKTYMSLSSLLELCRAAGKDRLFITGLSSKLEFGETLYMATLILSPEGYERIRKWDEKKGVKG